MIFIALRDFLAAGHAPKLLKNGKPDDFAMNAGEHNGYCCIVCEATVCIHCYEVGNEPIDQCRGRRDAQAS